jgi:hypothetical protein
MSVYGRKWHVRLWSLIRTHWQFSFVLLAAGCLRLVVMLGYPPVLWFNDSYNYLYDAYTHVPDLIRPNGYAFLLGLVLPLHGLSLPAIAILQAAMGLAMGVAVYALLRHRGLPWWGSALCAAPVLFDSYEVHVEHMITADPLFTFLVTLAVVMLCWSDRPSVTTAAAAGLLIGYATVVRSVGEPLLAVAVVGLLLRRVGWQRLAAVVAAAVVPVGAYMIWFHASSGHWGLTESRGTFLYSRVMSFANCKRMGHLSADMAKLCDRAPPKYRPPAQVYPWVSNDLGPYSGQWTGLYNYTLSQDTSLRFTPRIEPLTQRFAVTAIESQPVAYARTVLSDTLHTFGWIRQPDPQDSLGNDTIGNGNGPEFQFGSYVPMVPDWAGTLCFTKDDQQACAIYAARKDFAGQGLGNTRAVAPWNSFLQDYQRVFYLRGTLLGLIVLTGLAGAVARWRRRGGLGLVPWLTGALLIVLPPVTAGFSYRYVLAAVPVTCLAAGLAVAGLRLATGGTPKAGLPGTELEPLLIEEPLLAGDSLPAGEPRPAGQ